MPQSASEALGRFHLAVAGQQFQRRHASCERKAPTERIAGWMHASILRTITDVIMPFFPRCFRLRARFGRSAEPAEPGRVTERFLAPRPLERISEMPTAAVNVDSSVIIYCGK